MPWEGFPAPADPRKKGRDEVESWRRRIIIPTTQTVWDSPAVPPEEHEPVTRKQDLQDRLQRAESWLKAAQALDPARAHEAFVFHYIALNAMYGRRQYEGGDRTEVRDDLRRFLGRVKRMHDKDVEEGGSILLNAMKSHQAQIEALILDYFLLDDLFKGTPAATLKHRCNRDATKARLAWAAGDIIAIMETVLYRLTVLRNRVMHGCVTFGPASKGLISIRKGVNVTKVLLPALLELMAKYGHFVRWDPIPYPRVGFADPDEQLELTNTGARRHG